MSDSLCAGKANSVPTSGTGGVMQVYLVVKGGNPVIAFRDRDKAVEYIAARSDEGKNTLTGQQVRELYAQNARRRYTLRFGRYRIHEIRIGDPEMIW
ncbi:MAG: hypothetical protein WAS74_01345 [Candidatus Saccharimonas aalborgensis]